MGIHRAGNFTVLAIAVLALTGCSPDRAVDIGNIQSAADPLRLSVTSARLERTWGNTQLILEMTAPDPSASITLPIWVDLGNSYLLWCEGEPRMTRSSTSASAIWTYGCEGDTDWPSDTSEADITVYIATVPPESGSG